MTADVRRPRRRHRILIPLLLGALVLITTLVTHEIDQPDQTDRGFLSPLATGDDGGSRLAASLTGRGVVVQRETDTIRALRATRSGPAVLFVPAPELLHPQTVGDLALLTAGTRLVLVDPPRRVLAAAGLPLRPTGRRWAAQAVAPGPCPLTEITSAATVAVARQRYAPTGAHRAADLCFTGGLARLPGLAESVVVGASDPFRNSRIDEWDNHDFATGLLATAGRVIWLDLDGPAPPPPRPSPVPTSRSSEPGYDGYGRPGYDGDGRPGEGQATDRGPVGGPYDRGGGDAAAPGGPGQTNPLWSAFPPWFWAVLAQLALAALLVAAGRARRLGPPTPEPLPVTVPAAETVLGRARLYQQAQARDSVAQALRAAARTRLARQLHLPADTPPTGVAAAVAASTGEHPDSIDELLHGGTPATDRELLELADGLDRTTRDPATRPALPPAGTGTTAEPRPAAKPPRPRPEGETC